MESIPYLTREDVIQLDTLLLDYIQKAEASLTLLLDKGGSVIAQQGDMEKVDVTIIAALAAGSFAATKELANRIGEKEFKALYHQGRDFHIFMSAVDEDSIITTVFNEKTTVGLVRFYTVNLISQLAPMLDSLRHREVKETHLFQLETTPTLASGKVFS
ncbi:MAG: roadblock/LC7 domain-containing protein [Verrucomicrobiae bacterium]|nr:roadblock/LC7 domain-containing protein [Verrucomicrobiae bacterium]